MGSFHNDNDDGRAAYDQIQAGEHGPFSHQLIASAAAYAAMKQYEQAAENQGKPKSYEEAQKTIAKLAREQAENIVNSKGLNDVDESKAKSEAEEKAVRALTNSKEFGPEQYGGHAGGRDKGHEERHNERFDEERRAEKRAF